MATATLPAIRLMFDVERLDSSCSFYLDTLGFTAVNTQRAGQFFESRMLRSPQYPDIELTLRATFGKRVTGCRPGSILHFSLRTSSLPAAIRHLTGKVQWVGTSPEANPDEPRSSVKFADLDGYIIELFSA